MKIRPPKLELEEYEGFESSKDIFRRRNFGMQLTNLVKNTEDELVLALDAPWGQGKTTFVKMWRGQLQEESVRSIYFDAFENDFEESAILSLVAELYTLLDANNKDSSKEKLKSNAVTSFKAMARAGLRVGIRAATAGVLDDTVLAGAEVENELSSITDSYVEERLEEHASDKYVLERFRSTLADVVASLGDGKVVFIVDELDRCNPLYALQLLEAIKHVFTVRGMVFVLVPRADPRSRQDEIWSESEGREVSTEVRSFVGRIAGADG